MDALSKAMAAFDINKVKESIKLYTNVKREDSDSSFEIYPTNDFVDGSKEPYRQGDCIMKDQAVIKAVCKTDNDSGIAEISKKDYEFIPTNFEQKIDKLTELLVEQNQVILSIKNEVKRSNVAVQHTVDTHTKLASELLKLALIEGVDKMESTLNEVHSADESPCNAKALMSALKVNKKSFDVSIVKKALRDILESDEFSVQLTNATTSAIRSELGEGFSKRICSSYLAGLEKSQRRVLYEISHSFDNAFRKLNINAAVFVRESCKASRAMRVTLDRHMNAVEAAATLDPNITTFIQDTVHEVLKQELQWWRENMIDVLTSEMPATPAPAQIVPPFIENKLPQFKDHAPSAIDHLMCAAQVKINLKEGNINGAFERALTAADLDLVTATCRAADPGIAFGPPCLLGQNVLLSLLQQLSTDMLQDTQLKCRYMEEAIMNLNKNNAVTLRHASKVLSEVKRHLMSFLKTYPSHMFGRRLRMIIMAADSFMMEDDYLNKIF